MRAFFTFVAIAIVVFPLISTMTAASEGEARADLACQQLLDSAYCQLLWGKTCGRTCHIVVQECTAISSSGYCIDIPITGT